MSAAAMPEVAGVLEQAPGARAAQDGASCRRSRAQFTPEQQLVFNRAFAKREAKLRRELEPMRRDLLETCALTAQLLGRCLDRISQGDALAITTGLREIEREYRLQTQEAKCQTAH